jgi:aspartate racemase
MEADKLETPADQHGGDCMTRKKDIPMSLPTARGIPTLGILTGISYVSGLDYFNGINEKVLAKTPKCHLMSPNPSMVMVSVDCDAYVHYLTLKLFAKVDEHLLTGVRKLVKAGCDILVIASNTGHICVPAVEREFPHLKILHIADCCAARLKKRGFSKVGLIGTKPTMEEDYLKSRLLHHGITTVVPEDEQTQEEIYEIIHQELSYNIFTDESRTKMVQVIRELEAQGTEACILGCTEIELLVQQEHVPGFLLLPSAEIHIQTIANVLLGKVALEDVLPPEVGRM